MDCYQIDKTNKWTKEIDVLAINQKRMNSWLNKQGSGNMCV